jgi:hypothetical protein
VLALNLHVTALLIEGEDENSQVKTCHSQPIHLQLI